MLKSPPSCEACMNFEPQPSRQPFLNSLRRMPIPVLPGHINGVELQERIRLLDSPIMQLSPMRRIDVV